jgi:hypothetical protein
LDWTLSPYVAAYFALYEGFKKQSVDLHCAIWAIDIKWLNEHAWRVLARGEYKEGSVALDSAQFKSVFLQARPLVVAALQPGRMNDRVAAQQGLFLCPGDVSMPFEDNLFKVLEFVPAEDARTRLHRIELPAACRSEALKDLELMNVTHLSLFPGLDGLGRKLRASLEIREDFLRSSYTPTYDQID